MAEYLLVLIGVELTLIISAAITILSLGIFIIQKKREESTGALGYIFIVSFMVAICAIFAFITELSTYTSVESVKAEVEITEVSSDGSEYTVKTTDSDIYSTRDSSISNIIASEDNDCHLYEYECHNEFMCFGKIFKGEYNTQYKLAVPSSILENVIWSVEEDK